MSLVAMLKSNQDRPRREPVMAFTSDEITGEAIATAVESQSWSASQVQIGDLDDAIRALALTASPEILVIDIAGISDPFEAINQLADVCDPGTKVIAIGSVNDIELYRALVATGIRDYLVKPVDPETLATALHNASEPDPGTKEEAEVRGRLVTVIGARGGVGASTVAVSCAWLLAHEYGRQTALLDLDLHFGGAALAFDLEPGRGLREAVENPGRIDGLFIERAVVRESPNLAILSAEESLDEAISFNDIALDLLMAELRAQFQVVVCDLPRYEVPIQRILLSSTDEVVIVTDLTIPGLRDTIRLQAMIHEAAPDAQVRIVASQVGDKLRRGVDKAEFEKAIEAKITFILPEDGKTVSSSINAGQPLPLVNKRSNLIREMRKLAKDMGVVEDTKRKPLLARLLPKRSG